MSFQTAKHYAFDHRIAVHPAVANAYCTLSLTLAIMKQAESSVAFRMPTATTSTLSKTLGEQALMKALFLELMGGSTHDVHYYLDKYYHLTFVQNLIYRADFRAMLKTNNINQKQEAYYTLAHWLKENLNHMGLRYNGLPVTQATDKLTFVQNSAVLEILKGAMDKVLKHPDNRALLQSPSRFKVAVGLTFGLLFLLVTLSAMPHIVQGEGLFFLLVGAYGAYLTHRSIKAIRAPAFEANLSSQPNACDRETIVINENKIDVVPKSSASSSYGTFWKPEPPSDSASILDNAKVKIRQIIS